MYADLSRKMNADFSMLRTPTLLNADFACIHMEETPPLRLLEILGVYDVNFAVIKMVAGLLLFLPFYSHVSGVIDR